MTRKEEAELKRAAKLEAEKARCQQMKTFELEAQEKIRQARANTQLDQTNAQQVQINKQQVQTNAQQPGSTEDSSGTAKQVLVCGIDEAGRGPFAGPVVAGAVILDLENPEKEILYLNDSKKLSEKKRELLYRKILSKAVAVGVGYTGAKIIDQINILQATYRAMRMAISNLQPVSDLVEEEDDTHRLVEKLVRRELQKAMPAASSGDYQQQSGRSSDNQLQPGSSSEDQIQEYNLSQAESESISASGDSQKMHVLSGSKEDSIHIIPDYILADAVTIPGIEIPQQGIVKGDAKSLSIAAASIVAKVTRDHIMYEYDKLHPEYGFASHKGYGTAAHIAAIRSYGMLDIHRRSFIHLK